MCTIKIANIPNIHFCYIICLLTDINTINHFRLVRSFPKILCRSVISFCNSRSDGPVKPFFLFVCFKLLSDLMHGRFWRFIEVNPASRSLMNLKNNSNFIGPCDWLLQEDIALLHKISRICHETYQSHKAIDIIYTH